MSVTGRIMSPNGLTGPMYIDSTLEGLEDQAKKDRFDVLDITDTIDPGIDYILVVPDENYELED